jgi:predicted negative regulator of RcsB-dependent stress response
MATSGKKRKLDTEERFDAFVDWLEIHSRGVMYASIGLLVIAGGVWFWRQSNARQSESAQAMLGEAESAVASGNVPLAQSDLEKLVQRYGRTDAARQAHVLLAQVHYDRGEYQQGIQELKVVTEDNDAYTAASAMNLSAAGLEQAGKFADAAAMYQKAAQKAPYRTDRDVYMASAARALTSAGKVAEAKKIWSDLAKDDQSPANAEARVRLGELDAKAGA